MGGTIWGFYFDQNGKHNNWYYWSLSLFHHILCKSMKKGKCTTTRQDNNKHHLKRPRAALKRSCGLKNWCRYTFVYISHFLQACEGEEIWDFNRWKQKMTTICDKEDLPEYCDNAFYFFKSWFEQWRDPQPRKHPHELTLCYFHQILRESWSWKKKLLF